MADHKATTFTVIQDARSDLQDRLFADRRARPGSGLFAFQKKPHVPQNRAAPLNRSRTALQAPGMTTKEAGA